MNTQTDRSTRVETSTALNVDPRQLRHRPTPGGRTVLLPSGAVGAPSYIELARDDVFPDRVVLHRHGSPDRVWLRGYGDDFRLVRDPVSRGYVTAQHDRARP